MPRLPLSLSLRCLTARCLVLGAHGGADWPRAPSVQLGCFKQEVMTRFRSASVRNWLCSSGKLTDVKHCIPCQSGRVNKGHHPWDQLGRRSFELLTELPLSSPQRLCLNGSTGQEVIISSGLETVEALAFEPLSQLLYWVDAGFKKIEVCVFPCPCSV